MERGGKERVKTVQGGGGGEAKESGERGGRERVKKVEGGGRRG